MRNARPGKSGAQRGDRSPHTAVALAVVATMWATAAPAAADPEGARPAAQPPGPRRSTGDLDGDYLLIGPVGGAVDREGAWDTAFGAHAAWLRIRERRPVSALGVGLGGVRYATTDGGRLWLEGVIGTRRLAPRRLLLGVSAGPAVELGAVQHPRLGASASVWLFAGVTPYARVGWLDEAGSFVELGIALALPVVRL